MTPQKRTLLKHAFIRHLLWFLPLMALICYVHIGLPDWCDSYFGVPEIQKSVQTRAFSSEQAATPLSLFDSFGSFMTKTTTNAKLYMLSSVSTATARLGQLLLDMLGLILIWKWISQIRKSYQTKNRDSDLVQAVISQLQPELRALRQEVARLSTQLNKKGKNT